MELNVGDYVRTKSYGIKKINDFSSTLEEDFIDCDYDKSTRVLINKKDIVKSSPNIIDLIEVGDYVNGHKVIEHSYEPGRLFVENIYVGGKGQTTIEDYSYELTSKYCYDEPDFIKSIVTKEQFEAMQYVVKED